MAVLFDSKALPASEADEALSVLFAEGGLPISVSHVRPREAGQTSVEQWSLAEQHLFVARGNTLRLARSVTDVKAAAPERLRLGFQLTGSYTLTVGQHREKHSAGQLNITDLTQPCEFTQYDPDAAVASLEVDWDDLGLSAEAVRRSMPRLQRSPVYPLMQAHMARLCANAGALGRSDVAAHIARATSHLAQALIASVDADGPRAKTALNEALDARVVEYMLLHLPDPSLTPQSIAAAHHISLRHLYRLWAHNEIGLAEWIIAERLARAAGALATESQQRRPISAIAYSLGFKDPAHFSRRFRSRYGVPPHLWRREAQHHRVSDARDPGT
jgi:AraC-like DNA-binding protein